MKILELSSYSYKYEFLLTSNYMAEDYLNPLNTKLDADQVIRRAYDEANNRLRVDAVVTATIGTVDCVIDASTGDNIAIADSTGSNFLKVNPDGSLDVNITDISLDQATDSVAIGDGTTLVSVDPLTGALLVTLDQTNVTTKNIFNEITGVVSGVTSIIVSYTAVSNTKLLSVDVSGTNVAAYSIYIGGVLQAKKYSYYTNLNERFQFADGLPVANGDLIEIEVLHNRPDPGDFSANVLVLN